MRAAKRLGHVEIGVAGVEDVVLEVAADLDVAQRDVRDAREGLRGKLRLCDGVVLELEIGVELHQLGPVGARAGAHPVAVFSSSIHVPSKRTTPRMSSPG